ncbi:uncharacterized protein LOC105389509 [Plutella xylostella]|uniref:uncharacterized protein LOC105389509 n=1 Tax=Plutella xylostella TaxID=51655 RepID=UPI00203293C8|nr:uncharacterized protein LOC105389509 [Plutella xylostella]
MDDSTDSIIELLKQKFRAKCRFRALVRYAISNLYWLKEGVPILKAVSAATSEQYVEPVKKSKLAKKINFTDKVLLNKPAEDRTIEENRYLNRLIGNLKCFRRYPNYVKRQLSAVTYFKYYGPKRTIIREGQEPMATYFIISGEVNVYRRVWDGLLEVYELEKITTLSAGDMFGEVALLYNIARTATCVTVGHCELLVMHAEDFMTVLKDSLQIQWDNVRLAMSAFTYFQRYDEPSIREGCISAKLLCFKPGDTIYGDGKGFKTYAYFVISGRCQMIESLRIGKMKIDGQTVYGLYDNVSEPEVEPKEQEINFDKYFQRYEGKLAKSSESSSSADSTKNSQPDFVKKYNKYVHKEDEELICLRSPHISYEKLLKTSFRVSVLPEDLHREPRDMKTYFMQVCQFTTGASFGFGESIRDRRIVALTETRCLLLPLVYLYQRNTAGIWTRIRHYLDRKIPNKEKLFDDFFLEVEWSEFKEPIIEDIVARRSAVNHTTIHDVPYAIRMEELVEF